jgi:NitT/TauT family transport system permease protein
MPAREWHARTHDVWAHEQSLLVHEQRRSADHRRSQALRVFAVRIGVLAGFLVAWSAASGTLIDSLFVSDPISVARSFVQISIDGTLWWHLRITLLEMTLGYILGVAVGVGLAIVIALIWRAEQIVRPLMLGVFAIPKVALAPLVIVWFGIHLLPKVILAASLVLFIVYFSTLAGFAAVNRDLIASIRVMGASRAALFLKLILPSAAPYIFRPCASPCPGH